MALYRIAFHHARVTAGEAVGYAMAAADGSSIVHRYRLHPEAIGAQVIYPRAAAASVGVEIDVDVRRLRPVSRPGRKRRGKRREKSSPVAHPVHLALTLIFPTIPASKCPGIRQP